MRKFFAIAAAVTFGISTCQRVLAADLPAKAQPMPVPVMSWTGCYLGGNFGGTWGSGDIAVTNGAIFESRGASNSGFAIGGQIGCDYQTGPFVFGIRNLTDWSDRETSRVLGLGALAGSTATLRNNWIDLLTGRVGYAVSPRWLLYFQGGGAWRDSSLEITTPGGLAFTSDRTQGGWAIGGGAEWKFAPNWSVFLEYNHADFGSRSATFATVPFGAVLATTKSDADLFLVGANWRFSGGY